MVNKTDVTWKIVRCQKLTLSEFELAQETGIFTDEIAQTDEELAKNYLYYLGRCYEDGEYQSYLCDRHPTRAIKGEKDKKTRCAWGIHLDEIKPDKLTRENIQFLRHHFGKAKVRELTGR